MAGAVPSLCATLTVLLTHVKSARETNARTVQIPTSILKFAWLNTGRLMDDITDLRPGTSDYATYPLNVVAAAPKLEPKPIGRVDRSALVSAVSGSEEAEPIPKDKCAKRRNGRAGMGICVFSTYSHSVRAP